MSAALFYLLRPNPFGRQPMVVNGRLLVDGGVFWAFVGTWAVLPFSGLEAGLVAWLMYRVCQATYQRQVITCSPQQVRKQP